MEVFSAFFAANLLWVLVVFVIIAVLIAESYENFGWGLFSVAIFLGATIFWKAIPWSDWRNFNWWYTGVYIAGMFVYGLTRMFLHGRKIGSERIAWKEKVQSAVDNKTKGYQELLSNYQKSSIDPKSYDYQQYVPSSKDSKKKYAFWTVCWPSSLLLYLFKDLVVDFVKTFKNLFDRTVVSGENSALKGVDLSINLSEEAVAEAKPSSRRRESANGGEISEK